MFYHYLKWYTCIPIVLEKMKLGGIRFELKAIELLKLCFYERATNVSYKIILYSFFIFQQWIWCNFRILNIEYEYNALVIIFKFSIRLSIIMNSHLLINIELYQTGFFFKLTISYSVFLIVYPFLQTQDK